MVFNQNLVAVIKNKGEILRETREEKDVVYIPFGSEYSILLKNLNTVKALVDVEIDGRKAMDGLIIHPNSSVELERFFENNMNNGHKFKFIEKTDDIKNYRGDKIEDGIIRISYKFEKSPVNYYNNTIRKFDNQWNWDYNNIIFGGEIGKSRGEDSGDGIGGCTYYSGQINNNAVFNCSYNASNNLRSMNNTPEEGITVEGNDSNQEFIHGYIGELESVEYCINIQLKGFYPNKGTVKKPLTISRKITCKYCGKSHKSNNKFCSNCGAALI